MKTQARRVQRGIVSVRAESDPKALIEQLNKAFYEFKAEHTAQLEDIKKGYQDTVKSEKLDKINDHITELQTAVDEANAKIVAAQLGAGETGAARDKEYTAAWLAHFRKGEVRADLNKGADAEGGYLAPVEWDRTITDRLIETSPMRSICQVQTISTAGFSKLFNNRGMASGWVGETAARPKTDTPEFGSYTYTPGEIYANPAATQQMLDDAEVNLEAWIASEVEQEFAYQEGLAFIAGDGVNKPKGLLTYVDGGSNDDDHPWGEIATVASGGTGVITSDAIIQLVHALPSVYTGDAGFVMNRSTQEAVRLLKDGQNNYLWQPSFQAGQPATLAGYPITEMPGMPDVAADAIPIVFGDFRRGYLIVDRVGVRVLRDPFTNKPFVHFYTTKRVGGGLLNPDVLKALEVDNGD